MSLNITIITGARGSGKTTYLRELLEETLPAVHRNRVGGIITSATVDTKNGCIKTHYMAVHVPDGEARLLLAEGYSENWKPLGRFWYDPETFSWAIRHIKNDKAYCSCLVIDEIGPLELRGGGYSDCLKELMQEFEGELVLVIRKEILSEALSRFFLAEKNIQIYDIRGNVHAE